MSVIFIFLAMLFCHVVDDYYLQGWLASAKQKKWWRENATLEMYKNDYIVALIMHSLSWSFMIMLPIAISMSFNVDSRFLIIFLINIFTHAITDNAKANRLAINLVQDQSVHIIQICLTFLLLIKL